LVGFGVSKALSWHLVQLLVVGFQSITRHESVLALTPIMLCLGLVIFSVGKGRLAAANDVPTDEEDLRAIKDISDHSK
jgi:hypothetical protein